MASSNLDDNSSRATVLTESSGVAQLGAVAKFTGQSSKVGKTHESLKSLHTHNRQRLQRHRLEMNGKIRGCAVLLLYQNILRDGAGDHRQSIWRSVCSMSVIV